MNVYVATKNAGKLVEMPAIFARSALRLLAYDDYADVVEDGETYLANALLKARALAEQLRAAGIGGATLADDSGLEVEALDGRPGVLSARYAGPDATWPQRRVKLLAELNGVPEESRGARFVATMALVLPNGDELTSFGTVAGRIVEAERGSGGFGYDPVFFYPARNRTFAELSFEEKNAVSHRGAAAEALLKSLQQRG